MSEWKIAKSKWELLSFIYLLKKILLDRVIRLYKIIITILEIGLRTIRTTIKTGEFKKNPNLRSKTRLISLNIRKS